MNTTETTSPALVDTTVREIATLALNGDLDQQEARRRIAGVIHTLDIPGYVARRYAGLDWQGRRDLEEGLQNIIENKCLIDAEGSLDLTQVLTKSASGWARQLAKAAAPRVVSKNWHNRNRERVVDPTLDVQEAEYVRYETLEFHLASNDGGFDNATVDAESEELSDLAEEFNAAASGTRESRRLRLSASALLNAYALPDVIRPEAMLDREWVREQVAANTELARNSVRALLSLVTSYQSEDEREIDDRLLSLWDDYTADQLTVLAAKPERVAQTLVLAAVSPKARPNRDVLALALATLRMGDSDDSPREYNKFTRQLLNSWVASECAAMSEFDTKGELTPEKQQQRMADALAWPELAAQAAARPGHPFGATVEAVERHISDIVETLSV